MTSFDVTPADHYQGLDDTFEFHGKKILCTAVTGALCHEVLGVNEDNIIKLPWDTPVLVLLRSLERGFFISLTDANHCPGAAMVFFEVPKTIKNQQRLCQNAQELKHVCDDESSVTAHCLSQRDFDFLRKKCGETETSLHSGDMRYHSDMLESWTLRHCRKHLDRLYLDSTYARPRHTFVPQEEAIDNIDKTVEAYEKEGQRNLYVVCTYLVGKERILLKLAQRLAERTATPEGNRVWLSQKKMRILEQLALPPKEHSWFTTNKSDARIFVVKYVTPSLWCGANNCNFICRLHLHYSMHVAGKPFPYFQPDYERLRRVLETEYPRFNRIVVFVPTGWVNTSKHKTLSFGPVYPRKDEGFSGVEDIEENEFVANSKELEHENYASRSEKIDGYIHLEPYSEHSSFAELKEFIASLKPITLIPTVFANQRDQDRIRKLFTHCVSFRP